jgi:sugar phosphate isomerase/epimerase
MGKISYMRTLIYFFAILISLGCCLPAKAQKIPQLGIVASLEQDSLLAASGFQLLGELVGKLLAPSLTEAQFQDNLKKIKKAKTKVYLCNVLFPGSLKIAGPEVAAQEVLAYLDQVAYRAKRADIPLLVLGSGGSRRLPQGYDNQKAKNDFVLLCRQMALVARKHGIIIALESLNSTETNFLTTLQEAAEVVKKVGHPNFRLNADIYHMMKENEPPQHIIDAGSLIYHVEIAEKDQRTLPGVKGDDFRPYFRALKAIRYQGPIVIEGRINNASQEMPQAHQYLTRQLREVYGESKF